MKAVEAEAKQAGINSATLRRAKTRLKVRSRKVGIPGNRDQKWVWELLDGEGVQPAAEGAHNSGVEHLRVSDTHKGAYDNNLAEGAHVSDVEHLRHGDEHIQAALDKKVWAGYPLQVGGEAQHD